MAGTRKGKKTSILSLSLPYLRVNFMSEGEGFKKFSVRSSGRRRSSSVRRRIVQTIVPQEMKGEMKEKEKWKSFYLLFFYKYSREKKRSIYSDDILFRFIASSRSSGLWLLISPWIPPASDPWASQDPSEKSTSSRGTPEHTESREALFAGAFFAFQTPSLISGKKGEDDGQLTTSQREG